MIFGLSKKYKKRGFKNINLISLEPDFNQLFEFLYSDGSTDINHIQMIDNSLTYYYKSCRYAIGGLFTPAIGYRNPYIRYLNNWNSKYTYIQNLRVHFNLNPNENMFLTQLVQISENNYYWPIYDLTYYIKAGKIIPTYTSAYKASNPEEYELAVLESYLRVYCSSDNEAAG